MARYERVPTRPVFVVPAGSFHCGIARLLPCVFAFDLPTFLLTFSLLSQLVCPARDRDMQNGVGKKYARTTQVQERLWLPLTWSYSHESSPSVWRSSERAKLLRLGIAFGPPSYTFCRQTPQSDGCSSISGRYAFAFLEKHINYIYPFFLIPDRTRTRNQQNLRLGRSAVPFPLRDCWSERVNETKKKPARRRQKMQLQDQVHQIKLSQVAGNQTCIRS